MSEQASLWDAKPTLRGAIISPCGKYRNSLFRVWDDGPLLYWVMLNPSTADGDKDDPTVRKCIGFSKFNGFGSLMIENLVPYRATKPEQLKWMLPPDLLGSREFADEPFRRMVKTAKVVVGWGQFPFTHNNLGRRMLEVIEMLPRPLFCVGQTSGRPWHPLYVPYGSLKEWQR